MINLDHKAFYWKEFDEDSNPINPKECQIIFNPKDGGKLVYLLDVNERLIYNDIKDNKIEILYGQANYGKKFTLFNLKFESARPQITANLELTEVTYSIEYIFYDGWVDKNKQLDVIHVRYSYLELWFNQMEIKEPFDNDEKTMAGIMVHKEHLNGTSAEYDVLFNIEYGFNQNSFNNKKVVYEATNSLAIAKKDSLSVTNAMNLSLTIKSFFEIMTFYSNNKIFIEEFYTTQKRKLRDGRLVDEIVYLLFQQDEYIEEQEMYHIDFLLRYEDIKENFVQILNNWIEHHHKNENEFNSFCNVISDNNTKFNIYSHFFQLISALEGYHRKNHETDKNVIREHERYIKKLNYKLKPNLNNKQIQNIISKLKNNNELNFRVRLKELIELSGIKSIIKLSNKTHKSISSLIYDTRNDIAHSNKNIISTDKIKYAYEYLKLVSLLIMIKDISLNHNYFSKHIFDMEFKYLQENLEKAFSKNKNHNYYDTKSMIMP